MPLIKSAKKKMRQDVKRKKRNIQYERAYKQAVEKVKKQKKIELVKKAYSTIDKAVKKKVIHKNKGARLKAMVAKLVRK